MTPASLTRRFGLIAAAAMTLGLSSCGGETSEKGAPAAPTEITFSILSAEGQASAGPMWEPLLEDMSKAIGIPVKPYFGSNYTVLVEAMRGGQTQVAWFAAKSAVEAIDRADAEVMQARAASERLNADLQARLATLEAERAQEKQIAKLQRNADDFFKLVEAGKSTPAQKDDEMAVLAVIPDELRDKYLALRNQGTNAWPTGPRQSVILAKAPGEANADAELDALATLGADMGFAPKKS